MKLRTSSCRSTAHLPRPEKPEKVDTYRNIEERSRLHPHAVEVHELGPASRPDVVEVIVVDFEGSAAFVPSIERRPKSTFPVLIGHAERAHVPLVVIGNETLARANLEDFLEPAVLVGDKKRKPLPGP